MVIALGLLAVVFVVRAGPTWGTLGVMGALALLWAGAAQLLVGVRRLHVTRSTRRSASAARWRR